MLAASIHTKQMTKRPERITFFFTKQHAYRKILKYKLCRVVDPSKKVPDLIIVRYRVCY